jgi:hypothetical protein
MVGQAAIRETGLQLQYLDYSDLRGLLRYGCVAGV